MLPLIEAVDVSKRFAGGLGREGTLALAGLSLAIDAGRPSIIAVVGESGSGKTTLARLLLGLVEPTGDQVEPGGWHWQCATSRASIFADIGREAVQLSLRACTL